jgi:CHASE3 domain sensor protein
VALGTLSLFWAYGQIEQAAEKRQRNHIVISQAQDLMSQLKDAETGQRGYSLTGDEAFLEPYLNVREGLAGRLQELRELTKIQDA